MTRFQEKKITKVMENQRLVIFVALCFVSLILWNNWQQDYGPKGKQAVVSDTAVSGSGQADVPNVKTDSDTNNSVLPAASVLTSAGRITVTTDVFELEIDKKGGDIRKSALRKYPVTLKDPNDPMILMDDTSEQFFIAQSGLLSKLGAPTHETTYSSAQDSYQMQDDSDSLTVSMQWTSDEGVVVNKIYVFHRNSYLVDVRFEVENTGLNEWSGRPYGQLQRLGEDGRTGFVYTYVGAAISSPDKRYEKITFSDIDDEKLSRDIIGGWAGMLQHYFVAAFIPAKQETYHYYTLAPSENKYIVGLYGPELKVQPGEHRSAEIQLYAGPKIQDKLEKIAPGLELTVDYGVLWFLAKPLFWLLQFFHGVFGNWGWSIIMVTVVVKALFFHLSAKSYKSMANMRRMQPKMVSIKEKFGDDKARLNQEMMELYKKEKINPLGGCLPILIQIPVFISLYWVLLESVELRHAPFILWIHDMSAADPYYVLPLLMGISMFIQQKLNPAPVDPIQAKVMSMLPIVFSVFFAFFPAGLVLYWVVNNVLSITQQWVITKRLEESAG